jgi:hypothetical protein
MRVGFPSQVSEEGEPRFARCAIESHPHRPRDDMGVGAEGGLDLDRGGETARGEGQYTTANQGAHGFSF